LQQALQTRFVLDKAPPVAKHEIMRQLSIYSPFHAPVYHEETVASTMDVSRLLAAQGEPHGTVITADFQQAGRGRVRDRCWNMEKLTSLPFTILLRYPQIESIPAALTLRTGLAAARAIEDFAPALAGKVRIKWPNDIMIDARKAAGILTEAGGGTVFIGIGVNMAQKQFPAALQNKAVSIGLAAGINITSEKRFTLLEKILACLYDEIEPPRGAAAGWQSRLERRLYKKGEQVRFAEGAAGSEKITEGRLAGLGPGGELLIVPNGESVTRSFITGELRVY
jgi:BirA family biotin operon repressor/biotin-[acetyl-CoA-carboxylase] ligase